MDACPKNYRKQWRKEAKKLRRKRLRQKLAIQREQCRKNVKSSPTFLTNLANRLLLEQQEAELEEEERKIQHEKWLQVEKDAQKRFCEEEALREKELKARQEASQFIQKEWKAAKMKKEENQRLAEQNAKLLQAKIDNYIENGGEVPEELNVTRETNPGREMCPFFNKVAACRFGAACSRNHITPGISRVIVIPSFYTHFTLYQNRSAEYDTDVGLEFEERDTYRDFCDFFDDVFNELRRFGELLVIQVCRNSEPHLRGNLYAEYKSARWALAAAKVLHARWYAGKQLTVRFGNIGDWGAAVCGDFRRSRCPKGTECNFLHVFRNPRGFLMPTPRVEPNLGHCSERSWRWSESPERPSKRSSTSRHRKRDRREESRRSSRRRENWSSSPERKSGRKRQSTNRVANYSGTTSRTKCRDRTEESYRTKESPLRSRNRN